MTLLHVKVGVWSVVWARCTGLTRFGAVTLMAQVVTEGVNVSVGVTGVLVGVSVGQSGGIACCYCTNYHPRTIIMDCAGVGEEAVVVERAVVVECAK